MLHANYICFQRIVKYLCNFVSPIHTEHIKGLALLVENWRKGPCLERGVLFVVILFPSGRIENGHFLTLFLVNAAM